MQHINLSFHDGAFQASVPIDQSSTFHNIRVYLQTELDNGMFPADIHNNDNMVIRNPTPPWSFFINGIRMAKKQEHLRYACDHINSCIIIQSPDAAKARARSLMNHRVIPDDNE